MMSPIIVVFLEAESQAILEISSLLFTVEKNLLHVTKKKNKQFLKGISQLPLPIQSSALVINDNADIYGTLEDIAKRKEAVNRGGQPLSRRRSRHRHRRDYVRATFATYYGMKMR
jgi:hypothetical protein